MTSAPCSISSRVFFDLLRNAQPFIGDFRAAGKKALGKDADLEAGLKTGVALRIRGKFEIGGIFSEKKGFGALHALEDQRFAQTGLPSKIHGRQPSVKKSYP